MKRRQFHYLLFSLSAMMLIGFHLVTSAWAVDTTIIPAYKWHTFYGSISGDEGHAIAVDGSGNVYIAGESYATWNGPGGEAPIHGLSRNGLMVIKLGGTGDYQWHTFFPRTGLSYPARSEDNRIGRVSIALDAIGNVYMAGHSLVTWDGTNGEAPLHSHSGQGDDLLVIKLNSSGGYQWHTFYKSNSQITNYYNESVAGISVSGRDEIYVTAQSAATWNGPAGEAPLHPHSEKEDFMVLKLDSNGAYQWHTFYPGKVIDSYYNTAKALSIDANENVYVSGRSFVAWNGPSGELPLHPYSGNGSFVVLKLDSNGTYKWHTYYGSYSDDIESIDVDENGNVFLAGGSVWTWNGPNGESPLHMFSGGYDLLLMKLDSNGTYQWHTFYGSNDYDFGTGISVDGRGNFYVAGVSTQSWAGPREEVPLYPFNGNYDVVILKLNSDGVYQWHCFYGSNESDWGNGIAIDWNMNVFITGWSAAAWNGPAGKAPLHSYSGYVDLLVLKMTQFQYSTVPSLTEWGSVIMTLLLAGAAVHRIRRS